MKRESCPLLQFLAFYSEEWWKEARPPLSWSIQRRRLRAYWQSPKEPSIGQAEAKVLEGVGE